MSAPTAPIAIFGDYAADLWGVVIGGDEVRVAVAGLSDADVVLRPAELDRDDGDTWELTGAGCALRIERADPTTATADGEHSIEPCRVSGSATIAGTEREFDLGGVRSAALATADIDSIRLLAAWFPAGHEIALLSARPRGAKGQDHDKITVVARGEEHALVFDPRLSTTYDRHDAPRRAGIELWLGDDNDEDGEHRPRRVAGAATGSRVAGTVAGTPVRAYALECVSRGEMGAGIYVLLGA
ncbi:MAG TPA: hypothetical protein VMV16_01885 [Solirubrobacteraceae bacterium]|nr:hypothetical protein [Solirubrobacteraceae bacterium]